MAPLPPQETNAMSTDDLMINTQLEALTEDNLQVETEQRAVQSAWAELMGNHNQPVLHKKTAVLMLYWNPDPQYTDMPDVETEVFALRDVLVEQYRFKVVTQQLDTKTVPQQQAFRHLSNFVFEEYEDDGLLIVYYAGHGGSQASEMGQISLSGKYGSTEDERKEHSINWENVERVMEKTKSDILEIFLCCHAGRLCTPVRSMTRCFEILTACSPLETTPAPGQHSFTTAMTWALRELPKDKGFTTTALLNRILEAPNFSGKRGPSIFGGRFGAHSDYLYLAPMPLPGDLGRRRSGLYRRQRDEEVQQEEMLDLRFYYEGKITNEDLKRTAKAIRSALCKKSIRARRVSAIGKYSIETHDFAWRAKARYVSSTWKSFVRRKSSSQTKVKASSPTSGVVAGGLEGAVVASPVEDAIQLGTPAPSEP